MRPPFFTWSLSIASAAVVPGAPAFSSPISHRISATESPIAGVGARERSMMPNGTPSRADASFATSWPTRVTLKAVFLMVSESASKSAPWQDSRAFFTTPGPETPTFRITSASVTPWKAPAINGLSSGALQKTTSFAQPFTGSSFVSSAVSLMMEPIKRTASMSMPVLVDPRFTEEQTTCVSFSACGMERIRSSSAFVMPLDTRAL